MGVFMDSAPLSTENIWAWQQKLAGFGPRLTGSSAHAAFTEFLAAELTQLGLLVQRDRMTMTRWEARRCEVALLGAHRGGKPLPITAPFPYSGSTGPQGVAGQIVRYRRAPFSFARASGKIAVIDIRLRTVPAFAMALFLRPRSRKASAAQGFPSPFISPLLSLIRPPDLAKAAKAGVLGVVCVWRNCSVDNAAHQVLPFMTPSQDCPALWVGSAAGDAVLRHGKQGGRVRLHLEAALEENIPTDTLFAVLPGSGERETIIVNTHTDGPNACQENGPVALLALAKHFASVPQSERRRTLVFAFVTGHFQLPQLGLRGQATRRWLDRHRELWDGKPGHGRAVAGVTLEHLGAMEWKDDAGLRFGPTGKQETEFIYAANTALEHLYTEAARDRTITRPVLLRPMADLYFGEGQPLFQEGVPTLSLITLPDYMCAAAPGGGIEKIDRQLLCEQIATFTKAIAALDKTPAEQLLQRERQPGWLLQAIVRRAKRFTFETAEERAHR